MSLFEKPTIKVIVNSTGIPNTVKKKLSDGSTVYNGLFYDIYSIIKENLKDKYNFVETYDDDFRVAKALNSIRDGEYDLGVHNFTTTIKRLKDVDFTKSIIVERDVIVYKPKQLDAINTVISMIRDVFLLPIAAVMTIGFVLGAIIFYIQPKRRPMDIRIPKKLWFRRSIIATIATFLSEAGMIAEESPLTIMGIVTTLIVMAIALGFNAYITAIATNRVIELNQQSKFNMNTINRMHILSLKGQSIGTNFKRYGAKVTEVSTGVKGMMKEYLEDTTKYDGVALETSVAIAVTKKYNLKMTTENFGFGDAVFAVNKERQTFLKDLNVEIKKLQESLETERICKKYADEQYSYLCVL